MRLLSSGWRCPPRMRSPRWPRPNPHWRVATNCSPLASTRRRARHSRRRWRPTRVRSRPTSGGAGLLRPGRVRARASSSSRRSCGYGTAVVGPDLQTLDAIVAPDLQTLVAIYDGIAEDYAAGRTWSPFYLRGNRRRQLPPEQLEVDGPLRRCRQLRHVPADPRRRWLERAGDRAPFVQRHARLPVPLVRRQRPAQRLRPALELQPQPAGGRRQPALRHARADQLPRATAVTATTGVRLRPTTSASARATGSR